MHREHAGPVLDRVELLQDEPFASPEIANCDIDGNRIINMLDLWIAAIHFGETDS